MSIGPLGGVLGSAAGAPRAQAKGNELDRNQQDAAAHQRQVATDQQAEQASGVGHASEDGQTSERDADGRRLWEASRGKTADAETEPIAPGARPSRDPGGDRGQTLDVSG